MIDVKWEKQFMTLIFLKDKKENFSFGMQSFIIHRELFLNILVLLPDNVSSEEEASERESKKSIYYFFLSSQIRQESIAYSWE